MAGMPSGHGRPVGRGHGQSLNAGLFVVGHGDHGWLSNRALQPPWVEDLHFLVNVQHGGHFLFELRIPSLDIVPNLVRLEFPLREDAMKLGAA